MPSNPYADQIAASEKANNIPAGLLSQLLQTESGFDPNAFNPASGATGIAQILPSTAADPGYGVTPVADLRDPNASINFAGQYLAAQQVRTGSWAGAVQAYGTVGATPQNSQQASLLAMAQAADNSGSGITGANLNTPGSLQNVAFGTSPGATGGALTGPTGAAIAATPGAGYPLTLGLQSGVNALVSGLASSIGDAFKQAVSGLFGSLENWVTRGFLIVLGVVLIAVALWRLLFPDVSAGDVAKKAVAVAAL